LLLVTLFINLDHVANVVTVNTEGVVDVHVQAVQIKSEKINEEKVKCQHMADLAMADLAEAMPALEEAMKVSKFLLSLSN